MLEKSRVVNQNPMERNFHIFYQCIDGIQTDEMRNGFGITGPDYYNYLNDHDCYTIEGTDDRAEFQVYFLFALELTHIVTRGFKLENFGNISM